MTSPIVQSASASMPLQPSSSSRRKRTASALSWQAYGLQMGKFLRHGSSISISFAAMDAMDASEPGDGVTT